MSAVHSGRLKGGGGSFIYLLSLAVKKASKKGLEKTFWPLPVTAFNP